MNKHIFLLFSLIMLFYGVTIRPIKNIDFVGSMIMQKGWHHEFQFISEIDASYGIELNMGCGKKTENSKDKLSSQVRYKVTDKATNSSEEKVINIVTNRTDSVLILDGNDPFFFETKRNHEYIFSIYVVSSSFDPKDFSSGYLMTIDYIAWVHHELFRYSVVILSFLFIIISIIIEIFAHKQNRKRLK